MAFERKAGVPQPHDHPLASEEPNQGVDAGVRAEASLGAWKEDSPFLLGKDGAPIQLAEGGANPRLSRIEAEFTDKLARLGYEPGKVIDLNSDRKKAAEIIDWVFKNKPSDTLIVVTAKDCGHCNNAINAGDFDYYASQNKNKKVFWIHFEHYGRVAETDRGVYDILNKNGFGKMSAPKVMAFSNSSVNEIALKNGVEFDYDQMSASWDSKRYEGAVKQYKLIPKERRDARTKRFLELAENLMEAEGFVKKGQYDEAINVYRREDVAKFGWVKAGERIKEIEAIKSRK